MKKLFLISDEDYRRLSQCVGVFFQCDCLFDVETGNLIAFPYYPDEVDSPIQYYKVMNSKG